MTYRSLAWLFLFLIGMSAGCSNGRNTLRDRKSSASKSSDPVHVTSRQAADVQFSLGRSLEESNNPAEAEAAYRKALENDPKRADIHARLAVLLGQKGDFPQASKQFADAIRRDPRNPDILCDQGYNFYLQRRWAEAEECLKKAIAIEARHARSHNNLGLVYARQDNKSAALAEFVKAGCDASDAQANLGLILAMEGRLPEAKQAYSAALAAKPASTAAHAGLSALASADKNGSSDRKTAIAKGAVNRDTSVARASLNQPALPKSSGP